MAKTFDHDKAMTIVDGDAELLVELIDLFKEQCSKLLDEIDQAIQLDNPKQLQHAAHTLKGAAGNIGAMATHEIALTLEMMGSEKSTDGAEPVFLELKVEIEKLEQATTDLPKPTVP